MHEIVIVFSQFYLSESTYVIISFNLRTDADTIITLLLTLNMLLCKSVMVKTGVDIITSEKLVDASELYSKTKTPAACESIAVSASQNSLRSVF